jgi:hypothetical protein
MMLRMSVLLAAAFLSGVVPASADESSEDPYEGRKTVACNTEDGKVFVWDSDFAGRVPCVAIMKGTHSVYGTEVGRPAPDGSWSTFEACEKAAHRLNPGPLSPEMYAHFHYSCEIRPIGGRPALTYSMS